MSGRTYPGRMFLTGSGDDFFDFGIGAMEWGRDEHGRVLSFLAPDVTGERPWEFARIYMMRSKEDWAVPGPVNGWDGNEGRPTLKGSVWLLDKKGWHGWIRNGDLVTA